MGITKRELAKRVAERLSIPVRDAREITAAVIAELGDAILEEQHVELRGFGVWDLTWRATRRVGRNLPGAEGAPVTIPGRWTVTFRPALAMLERLARDYEPRERSNPPRCIKPARGAA